MTAADVCSGSDSDGVLIARPAENRRLPKAAALAAVGAMLLVAAVWVYNGSRSTSISQDGLIQQEEMVVVPAYDKCSLSTENCIGTKCCKTTGFKCYMKDAGTAKCLSKCVPGKDGWCSELQTTKPVAAYPGQRLFCMAFYTENTGSTKENFELSLLRTQLFLGASLFGCPKWAVYSDVDTWLTPGPPELRTTKVNDVEGDFHLFKRKKEGTWVNAMMFYQAWKDIRSKSLFDNSDWFVKVDADAVFLPQRLLDTLKGYKVPAEGVYVENCKKVLFGFFGNLEVVSATGFNTFLSNLEDCKKTIDWKGQDPDWKYGPYGEDLFMQKCLDAKGVAKVSNFTITNDGACKSDRPKALQKVKGLKWKPDCASTKMVAMHPFKKPYDYFTCLAATQR